MSNKTPDAVLAFDVYGTLINPFSMEEHLRPFFGERAREASELWRGKQLEYSFRRALMKRYVDFNRCTVDALRFVFAQLGGSPSENVTRSLMGQYLRLPAYPDAASALEALAARGFRMVACTNGVEASVRQLLEHAGILHRFSAIVSVDSIGTYKPDPAVYEFLTTETRAPKENVWLISSNPFDIIGANACGLKTAWVRRDPERAFDPWEFQPDITVSGLGEFATHSF